ncbi:MAG: MAPEG family protein [Polymorphobacter sp.]
MRSEILQPVAVLILWSLVMWLWMYAVRLPAINRSSLDAKTMVGSTAADLDVALPASVQWKAHNYNHLMEQPTIFYAAALLLAVAWQGDGMNALIAWVYVGFRIVHSLVQATVNRVAVRFALHFIGTIPLIMLAVHGAAAVF